MEDVLLHLIRSPLLAALVAVGGVLATIRYTNRREHDRLEHERALRLRDERIGAYCRLIAATTTAHTEREGVEALAAASAEITLLAGSTELEEAAAKVWVRYGKTQETARKMSKDPANTSAGDFAKALAALSPQRPDVPEPAPEESMTVGFGREPEVRQSARNATGALLEGRRRSWELG